MIFFSSAFAVAGVVDAASVSAALSLPSTACFCTADSAAACGDDDGEVDLRVPAPLPAAFVPASDFLACSGLKPGGGNDSDDDVDEDVDGSVE